MLRYTGHPLIDVGVATITAFVGKTDAEQVTGDDLNEMASYIEENYTRNPLRSFLTVAFTSNAWFAQDAYNPDKTGLSKEDREKRRSARKLWADRHLHSWENQSAGTVDDLCVFTGEPAVATALSGKLIAGRAGRAQLPLLQGDDNINFYPGGSSGIPISGSALLCLQAFPLGCAKVAGSLLAVHADDRRLTFRFAQDNLRRNLAAVSIAQQSDSSKLEEARHSLRTLLVGTLLDLQRARSETETEDDAPSSVTAYHLNNGKTPKLDIYYIPLEVTTFLRRATSFRYRAQWDALVKRGWQQAPRQTGKAKVVDRFEPRRNYLYEDVLSLPSDAPRFLRRYFLRFALRSAREDDPRGSYSPLREADLISWDLTELFAQEVLQMDPGRVDQIRQLGDRCAAYVRGENDRRFFQAFLTETRYSPLRLALIRADLKAVRRGQGPLITFDQFIEVFEEGEEVPRRDWTLARDLVLIRMIEQLHANGWLAGHAADIEDTMNQAGAEDGVPAGVQ